MITSLTERPPIDLSGAQAQVLAVEADVVYLGIGILDRVEYGDVLPLYDKEVRIALVRVHQLIGPHLCKAEVVERFASPERTKDAIKRQCWHQCAWTRKTSGIPKSVCGLHTEFTGVLATAFYNLFLNIVI